jgi:CMP-N-acetylneuraminic acid synthetase
VTDRAGTLAIVPARAGSRRLPDKNMRALGGKPMVQWTIEAALASASIDAVLVTSDDDAVLALARSLGVRHVVPRPAALATDAATSADVVLHALDACPSMYATLCLLQPTSPLRTPGDIEGALALHRAHRRPVVSVCRTAKPLSWCVGVADDGALQSIDAVLPDPAYVFNGAIYVLGIESFRVDPRFAPPGTLAFRMTRDHSIDVDEPEDFLLCEALLRVRDPWSRPA